MKDINQNRSVSRFSLAKSLIRLIRQRRVVVDPRCTMHIQHPIFDLHLQRIEEKLLKRLSEADRRARELQKLFQVIEAATGLAGFFSPELRNVLDLLQVGVADEDAGLEDAGLEDGTPTETRIADIQGTLDELLVFCAYVEHPIPQMSDACQESAGGGDDTQHERKQPARAVDGALAKKYADVVVEDRRIQQSLTRAGISKQIIKDLVIRKACREISTSFDKFEAARMAGRGIQRMGWVCE